ncbi:MAG TPA: DUF4153 domain-containing protein [Clostridiales bacterium]|nr:DUF4153 domain-containing protein [Clostridiales bacterium]
MNPLNQFIYKISKGALKSFQSFPASMACALLFTVTTMVEIELGWSALEGYDFLLSCFRWSFAFAALFSFMLVTAVQSRFDSFLSFIAANACGVAAAAIAFFSLYQWGGIASPADAAVTVVSDLAAGRMIVAMSVSLLLFIILAAYPKEESDVARSFFMTHKAFFIALLYGGVIMAGSSLIVAALETLVFDGLAHSIYGHLGVVSGFIGYSIFLGYFPDFRQQRVDDQRAVAQTQPRFIEILFGYILIPVFIALTLVLLGWALKTVLGGMHTSFTQLFGIAATYTLGGLWLYLMVTHHKTVIAGFYRRFYPIGALVILIFEAWALIVALGAAGLKISEYYFILLWLIAAISSVLLLIKKSGAYLPILFLICVLAVVSVLPFIGYQPTTIAAQTNRLTTLLTEENILQDHELVSVTQEPNIEVRENITDAVVYLAGFPGDKLPSWFDSALERGDIFKEKLGFEQTWASEGRDGDTFVTSVYLSSTALDVSAYRWAVVFNSMDMTGDEAVTVTGDYGTYELYWITDANNGLPTLKIVTEGKTVVEENFASFLEQIVQAHPGSHTKATPLEDLSLRIDTDELEALVVFQFIDGYIGPDEQNTYYNLDLNAVYLNEKMR